MRIPKQILALESPRKFLSQLGSWEMKHELSLAIPESINYVL